MSRVHAHHKTRATTLLEVLVTMVVLLVGILAVIQIFPRGLQILIVSRNSAQGTALARAELERLKARPDLLPEQIVPVRTENGVTFIDSGRNPDDLGPAGDELLQTGVLRRGGQTVGEWPMHSGANSRRRVVGETHRVGAPGPVGFQFGSLVNIAFGPADVVTVGGVPMMSGEAVYGADLHQIDGQPGPGETAQDDAYFLSSDGTTLFLPTGGTERRYRLVLSAFVNPGPGVVRRDFVNLPPIVVPVGTADGAGRYGFFTQSLALLIPNLVGVETQSVRVSRAFTRLAIADSFADGEQGRLSDPYQYKLLDPSLGSLLVNPLAFEESMGSAGGGRDPLRIRVDYDVLDWRILREDFRISEELNPRHRLPIGNIKVGGNSGPDGRALQAIFLETTISLDSISDPRTDHFVLMDLQTGGLVAERSMRRVESAGARRLISMDKSLGVVTFRDADADPTNGTQLEVLMPGAITTVDVNASGRPVRALYMANQEWSLQVLKAPSSFSLASGVPGAAQYYIGGTDASLRGTPTRIYFAPSETGNKVTVGRIRYRYQDPLTRRTMVGQLDGQDFVIRHRTGVDSIAQPLPSIDITDVVPGAFAIDLSDRVGVRGVRGASVRVRALYNPEAFFLTGDPSVNMSRLEQWGRNWRRLEVQTYLQRGESIR